MRSSGIKRIKLLQDFDWAFNPKIPRDKIMEFLHTDWLHKPSHLVLMQDFNRMLINGTNP